MKIATNVSRDAFGGITISNLALFDWLQEKDVSIVGIEVITARHILGAVVFRKYLPTFFSHHIINGMDVMSRYSWERASNLRKKWDILIEETKKILRQESIDAVLITGTYFVPWIIGQAARELGIPIVLRYAGVMKKEVSHKGYFVRKKLLKYEKWLASVASVIIYPSAVCKRIVEKEILQDTKIKSLVVPNPATVCHSKPVIETKKGRVILAAVGRWTPIKNFTAFINLHNQLLEEDWPHHAIIVSSRWDSAVDIPETVQKVNSMSHDHLLQFYRSIDLLLVTSDFETFSNVAAEAAINGTPVLVSKNVGFSEVLIKAGLKRMVIDSFADPEKVSAAVKKVVKVKMTKEEIRKLAKLVSPHLVHDKIIKTIEKVIKI